MRKGKSRPEIRKNECNGDWDNCKLSQLADRVTRKNTGLESLLPLTISSQYGLVNQIKYFNKRIASKNISNYYLIKNGEFAYNKSSSDGYPFGTVKRLDLYEIGVLSTLYIIFSLKEGNVDSDFLAAYYDTNYWHKQISERATEGARSHGLLNISAGDFFDTELMVPKDIKEQEFIGTYLKKLDELIALHQREIEKLSCMRKAMVDKMFPKEGEDVPPVRFKGYKGKWRFCEFSEIFIERHKIDTISEEYPQLSFTIEEGVIRPENRKTNKRDFLILDKANKKYLQTEYDDIIYNPANVVFGAIHRNALGKGCVSPIYKIFYTDQDAAFMECIVRHPRFIKEISRSMEGTVKKLRTLKPKAFLEMSAYIAPTIEEQQQIGEYFQQIDRLIEIEKEELEKIKHIKSACLEKMFV